MANQIGMQCGYWWGTELSKDLYKGLEYTAKLGVDYVELTPSVYVEMNAQQRKELRTWLADHGLGITLNGSMMAPEANLFSAEEKVVQAGLERCRRVMEGGAELGATVWTGVMHGMWGNRPAFEGDLLAGIRAVRARAIEGIARCMQLADEYNVTMGLEVVNRFEMYYLNTVADGIDFCRAVAHPRCQLLIDTYHMAIEEDNMIDSTVAAQQAGVFACLHAGETNRRIPVGGKSNIDWAGLGAALKSSGYTGPITLEPYVFVSSNYSPAASVWRNLQDPSDLASAVEAGKQGVAFLRKIVG